MDKRASKDEALHNRISSIEKRVEGISAKIDVLTYYRSVQNEFQNQREKCTEFHQILNTFTKDGIALDDVMRRIEVLFRGHEELLAGFKRFVSVYYELKKCDKRPVTIVDAMNFVNKVKERFGGESIKFNTFLQILTSFKENKTTHAEVYFMAVRLFQDQQDLLEEFSKFVP